MVVEAEVTSEQHEGAHPATVGGCRSGPEARIHASGERWGDGRSAYARDVGIWVINGFLGAAAIRGDACPSSRVGDINQFGAVAPNPRMMQLGP